MSRMSGILHFMKQDRPSEQRFNKVVVRYVLKRRWTILFIYGCYIMELHSISFIRGDGMTIRHVGNVGLEAGVEYGEKETESIEIA